MRSALVYVVAILLSLLAYPIARAQVNPAPSPTRKTGVLAPKQERGEEVDPEDVLRVNTTLVTSPALIVGRDRKLVPNLQREDFHVFEDGVEQNLVYFAPVDKPFTVALVIDTSHSMLFGLQDLQNAARAFVDKMRPNDRAFIVSFDNKIRVLAEPTSDRDTLRRAIRNLRQGGPTRLYDAIDFVINQRMDHMVDRKALILFSDGVDNASQAATQESNLRDVVRSDVLFYPIEFSTYAQLSEKPVRKKLPAGSGFSLMDYLRADAYLHQLAEETGVALFPAADIRDLDGAVASIVEELHNEYSLGYYPTTLGQPGEVRRIEVRVSSPQLQVRARTGYVVGQSGSLAPAAPRASATVAEPSLIGTLPINRSLVFDRVPRDSRWMCKGPGVPSDFAIVQEGFDAHCSASNRPDDATNAWFIRKPGPTETVCKGFLIWDGREMEAIAIPTGYAVVGEVVSPGCARSNDPMAPGNAWRIKLPGPQETICKGFLIPRGYVIRGEAVAADCPSKSARKNAWVILPKTARRP